jgi:hypothetical protein
MAVVADVNAETSFRVDRAAGVEGASGPSTSSTVDVRRVDAVWPVRIEYDYYELESKRYLSINRKN